MELQAHVLQALQLRLKSVSNKGHFTLEVERVFIHMYPRIAEGSLSNTTWYALRMRYKQCKLGWSPSVTNHILLFRSK
jgi:hypothetical protein